MYRLGSNLLSLVAWPVALIVSSGTWSAVAVGASGRQKAGAERKPGIRFYWSSYFGVSESV
eukprot:3390468-Amphidinium_carterae.1